MSHRPRSSRTAEMRPHLMARRMLDFTMPVAAVACASDMDARLPVVLMLVLRVSPLSGSNGAGAMLTERLTAAVHILGEP